MSDDWKEATGSSNTVTWDYREPGSIREIVGTYKGAKTGLGANQSTLYVIELLDGEKIGVWSTSVLDNKMSDVNIGDLVKITYLGKALNDKTKREYHDFKVQYQRMDGEF